ncbi:M23 family metallopeptidase [Longimicrobium terrae]|uniref:Murein DD-endopeptidase MepM/ murein hydrolase activator NlpD n=1 Tax=Longimicrobium terrae TaxID=1639882 RepID=A0A841H0P6_9BACT|nr:peptidoglycan DD-metalloendopeptidase family protein [Longimicrobium terrae]MBB4637224.1 murein DD-endopeptidase MepM/ murein hydrolase activator NlpD [Longimicrobium terrae]MBB6071514.1 murein DD-endopeptidase MepM/ murein hydrolase activator NlpD [Longimicrobium terrae]NNC30064.1 peptidoglycan DD-metalloendopeptidase family protein [Longimicrobium terrae]
MPHSRWTLMLVPHDNERVRSFQVSSRSIRNVAGAALVAATLMGTFSIAFFVKQSHHVQNASLRQENHLLATEVDQMRRQMEALDRSIAALTEKDEQVRVVAGLPEIDADVRKAGVGGPGFGDRATAALAKLNPRVGRKVEATSEDLGGLVRRAALLRSSMDEAMTQIQRNQQRMASTPTILPTNGHLSSLFSSGRYHPVLRITRPHKGIDIAARIGQPILAPARGRVVFAGNRSNGYGNMVEIDHGYGYITRYAHASRLRVHTGESVERGQLIADVGNTGLTSGPHLHYEVEVNGQQVDPMNFVIGDALP